ncbi:hypothetical protein CLV32_0473 [Pedobacter duraquae]|uniref:Uncharacterized protein n=1 Tax=Pedobacter duraquae TaxID=425511 RepID=A0A4R6IQE3_9SPHI|nr:hypothetical protein CLV32_0473 [Pedobacter duraquae]
MRIQFSLFVSTRKVQFTCKKGKSDKPPKLIFAISESKIASFNQNEDLVDIADSLPRKTPISLDDISKIDSLIQAFQYFHYISELNFVL